MSLVCKYSGNVPTYASELMLTDSLLMLGAFPEESSNNAYGLVSPIADTPFIVTSLEVTDS